MAHTRSARPAAWVSLLVFLVGARGEACDDPAAARPEVLQFNHTMYAACRVKPSSGLNVKLERVYGHVLFKQDYPHGTLKSYFYIGGFSRAGLDSADLRAVHVHQFGDIGEGCGGTGGHFNPYGVEHPAHPGDFGNFEVQNGKIMAEREVSNATLFGRLSIVGRAVVVHQGADDLGRGGDAASVLNGNAGARLACCVVGVSTDALWKKYV